MTMAFCAGLQRAVYDRLLADTSLNALIGAAIYDAPPEEPAPARLAHVTLGEERTRPFDTKTSSGAIHDFAVVVHSGEEGFGMAKRVAAAICAALSGAPLDLERGKLVSLGFQRATAERGTGSERRKVSLLFRAIIDQDV